MHVVVTPSLSAYLHRSQPERQKRDVRRCLGDRLTPGLSAPVSHIPDDQQGNAPPAAPPSASMASAVRCGGNAWPGGAGTSRLRVAPLTLAIPRRRFDELAGTALHLGCQTIAVGVSRDNDGRPRRLYYRRTIPTQPVPLEPCRDPLVRFGVGDLPDATADDAAVAGVVWLNPGNGQVFGQFRRTPVRCLWLPGPGLFQFGDADWTSARADRPSLATAAAAAAEIAAMGADAWLRLVAPRIVIVGSGPAAARVEQGLRRLGLCRIARADGATVARLSRTCDLLITVGLPRPLLTRCTVYSVAYHLVHLDVSFPCAPGSRGGVTGARRSAEVALFLPGEGCALCPRANDPAETGLVSGDGICHAGTDLDIRHEVALEPGRGPSEPLLQAACAVALQRIVGLATEEISGSRRTRIADQDGELRIDDSSTICSPCGLCRQAGIGDLGVP